MITTELRQPIWVKTPLGEGYAFLVTDYGWNTNMVWTVALKETGEIRHFNSTQIILHYDHTNEIRYKTPPQI